MKNNWQIKKLGEVVNILNGYAFKSSYYVSNGVKLLRMSNITREGTLNFNNKNTKYLTPQILTDYKKFILKEDDLVVAMTDMSKELGIIGKVTRVTSDDDILLNQRVGKFEIIDENINQGYLYYALLNEEFKKFVEFLCAGGLQYNVSASQVLKYQIATPPFLIQKKIVERLEAIRKAQELCNLQIQKTEELFESITISAFKDGETHKLGELFTRQTKTILPTNAQNQDFNYIGLENIESNTGEIINFKTSSGINIKSNKSFFRTGDVLYGKLRPYLNKVWLAEFDGICSTDIWVLQANANLIKALILATLLKSNLVVSRMSTVMTGTNLPRANSFSFDNLEVKIPTLNEQQKIVEKLEAVQNYKKLLQKEKILLKELFDSVLDKSMKGELDN